MLDVKGPAGKRSQLNGSGTAFRGGRQQVGSGHVDRDLLTNYCPFTKRVTLHISVRCVGTRMRYAGPSQVAPASSQRSLAVGGAVTLCLAGGRRGRWAYWAVTYVLEDTEWLLGGAPHFSYLFSLSCL